MSNAQPLPTDRAEIVVGATYFDPATRSTITVERMTVRNGWVFIGGTNARGWRVSADLHQHEGN